MAVSTSRKDGQEHRILLLDSPREMAEQELDDFIAEWSNKGVSFVRHSSPAQAPFPSRQEAFEQLKRIDDSDGAITGCVSFGAFLHRYKPIDADFCACLPRLGFLTGAGAGYDNIDDAALGKHGVYYCNTPEAVSVPTADSASTLILATLKHTIYGDRNVRRGQWTQGVPLGKNPRDATLGILGMGSIGRITCRQMQAFGMRVIYHNRHKLSPKDEAGAEYVEKLEDFLGECDVLSVHIPLSPSTRHFISTRELKLLKKGARIVNTARGPVVDEDALVKALKSGHIEAAGLDVFEYEPKVHPYLLESDRVLLQPHAGSHTEGTLTAVMREMLGNLESYLTLSPGEAPRHAVNRVEKPENLKIVFRFHSTATSPPSSPCDVVSH